MSIYYTRIKQHAVIQQMQKGVEMVNYVVEFTSNYTHMNAIVDQSQSTVLESHVNMKNTASRASNES